MTDDPIISAVGLTKSYRGTAVLKGIDLAVPAGSVLALLGPNGAGKTTTVRLLSTLLKPDAGRISIGGCDAVREPRRVKGLIGLAGQAASVDDRLTGRQNLVMFGRLHRLGGRIATARADELIVRFGLAEAADRPVKSYSGGMRRKLDLAASLIMAPLVLFLDEPTASLDPLSRATLWTIIRELVREGTTVLLTTQYLEEADQLADTVALIDDGRIAAVGTPAQLKNRVEPTRFELVAAGEDDFARLAALAPDRVVGSDRESRTVSFRAGDTGRDGLRELSELIAAVLASDVAINGYASREPTLDDVFFQLTGSGNDIDSSSGTREVQCQP